MTRTLSVPRRALLAPAAAVVVALCMTFASAPGSAEAARRPAPTATATVTRTVTATVTATATVTQTVTVMSAPSTSTSTTVSPTSASSTTTTPTVAPVGPAGTWTLAFADEFNGTTLDAAKWSDCSWAWADQCHGNTGNQQLEWNQAANCTVSGGVLDLAAKREAHGSYAWTSCGLTTVPSYAFRYGYMEERAKLPAVRGFWPAFWTWQVNGLNQWVETDAYEFYSDNHARLYLTQHSGAGGGCQYVPPFDPSAGFHVYGVDVELTGTTWWVDGVKVCSAAGTAGGNANIVTNNSVYSSIPPDPSTTRADKYVDYIRAWQH